MIVLKFSHIFVLVCKLALLFVAVLFSESQLLFDERVHFLKLLVLFIEGSFILFALH